MKSIIFKILFIILLIALIIVLLLLYFKPTTNDSIFIYSEASEVDDRNGHLLILSRFDKNNKCIMSRYIMTGPDTIDLVYETYKNNTSFFNVRMDNKTVYADTKIYEGLTRDELKAEIEEAMVFENLGNDQLISYDEF